MPFANTIKYLSKGHFLNVKLVHYSDGKCLNLLMLVIGSMSAIRVCTMDALIYHKKIDFSWGTVNYIKRSISDELNVRRIHFLKKIVIYGHYAIKDMKDQAVMCNKI